MAGGDEKIADMLKRYPDPMAAAKAHREAVVALSQRRPALPDNPTPEQLAAFRKAEGIPDTPEGYVEKLPEGIVLGEDDKALVKPFLEDALAANLSPAAVHVGLGAWQKILAQETKDRQTLDVAESQETTQTLEKDWGGNFKPNMNAVQSLLDRLDPETKAEFENARGASGRGIMNNPKIVRALAEWSRTIDPTAAVVTIGAGGIDGVMAEYTELKGLMADQSSRYWRGADAARLQARYRELAPLVEAQKAKAK